MKRFFLFGDHHVAHPAPATGARSSVKSFHAAPIFAPVRINRDQAGNFFFLFVGAFLVIASALGNQFHQDWKQPQGMEAQGVEILFGPKVPSFEKE